ncbi:hypothetical protein AVO42_00395 [Thiomicrospira sp. XS5]|uniref:hypothetical protein n=1 Tax=Thiomicrospira sp. XS5 TaxID=1775636 RepID=UPI000749151A|nr:hypothetical protein [Thiomicrospira sp. XS5]KUJ73915.1 hypothetical protein AVO42_00395 [Thiomicrospira sp. XS5]
MDFSALLAGITSAAGGGIIGVIGTGLQAWTTYKSEQLKMAHELKMRELDQAEITLEHSLKMQEVEATVKGQIAVAEQNRMQTETQVAGELQLASYQTDTAKYGGGFVDAIRGLMRPVLTLYFAILMALIAYQLFMLNDQFIGTATASYLLKDLVNAAIFLATTSVTWWFGSRPVRTLKG